MIYDVHTHVDEPVNPKELIAGMDRAGVQRIIAISKEPPSIVTAWSQGKKVPPVRESINNLAKLVSATRERVVPFCWLDPTSSTVYGDFDHAMNDHHFVGVKLTPTTWYPYDEKVVKVLEHIASCGVPVLFHSGIFWVEGDCSRRCRPACFEIMYKFPNVRFSLAHAGWPWTDECIAVAGKFRAMARANGQPDAIQMFMDLTPGTPVCYREDVFRKIFSIPEYGLEEAILFGTDSRLQDYVAFESMPVVGHDKEVLSRLGVSKEVQEKYFSKNFEAFVGGPC